MINIRPHKPVSLPRPRGTEGPCSGSALINFCAPNPLCGGSPSVEIFDCRLQTTGTIPIGNVATVLVGLRLGLHYSICFYFISGSGTSAFLDDLKQQESLANAR